MTRGLGLGLFRADADWRRSSIFFVAEVDWQQILGQNVQTDADSKISGSAHLWATLIMNIYKLQISHMGLTVTPFWQTNELIMKYDDVFALLKHSI